MYENIDRNLHSENSLLTKYLLIRILKEELDFGRRNNGQGWVVGEQMTITSNSPLWPECKMHNII